MFTKRIAAIASAMVLSVGLLIPAQAITAANISVKGTYNRAFDFSATHFSQKLGDLSGTFQSIVITELPADGTLKVGNTTITGTSTSIPVASLGSLSYFPIADYASVTSFKWVAKDSTDTSPEATASIDYRADTPVAQDQTLNVLKNTSRTGQLVATSNQPLTYFVVNAPIHGDLVVSSSKGTFTYTPDSNYLGVDTFTFRASNGPNTSASATVTLNIGDVAAPVAKDVTFSIQMKVPKTENASTNSSLNAIDANTPAKPLNYVLVTLPTKGTITSFVASTGSFTYTHNTKLMGTDTFTYKANNGYRDSNIATVTVDINPPDPINYRDLQTHWAKKSAGTLAVMDLVVGEQIQNMYYYYPNRGLTRAEFVMFLNSIMEIKPSTYTISRFEDVDAPHLITGLNAALEQGVTGGTPYNGKLYFYPDKMITRIEAMKMLDNVMKFPAPSTAALPFIDTTEVPSWAMQSIQNLVGYKIVGGSNGMLRPSAMLTRGEAAELLFKTYLERKK